MRLSADQVREALLHPNEGVRQLAFNYFADAHATDTAVTATVLEAIAKFGADQFVRNYHGFADLPHTAESVRWVVDHLTTRPLPEGEPDYGRRPFAGALFECPFDLFAPHEAIIPALRLEEQAQQLRRRREFHELSDDAVWERLGEVCRRLEASENPWSEEEMSEAEGLERTAGDRVALAERVLERVNGLDAAEFHFLDMFAIRIAGRLRLASAVPALVDFMTTCDETWHEDLEPALSRIGSDECVRLFREKWAGGEWDFRYTAACVTGNIHTDASVAACLELAAAEPDPYSRESVAFRLLDSAVQTFDTSAVEPTRQFLLKAPHTWDSKTHYERDLRGSLIDACTLTGERFPEYDRWRREEIEADAMARKRMTGLEPLLPLPFEQPEKPAPPPDTIVGKPAAGRNDPCPCGSGKKYKKCCGK